MRWFDHFIVQSDLNECVKIGKFFAFFVTDKKQLKSEAAFSIKQTKKVFIWFEIKA